MCMPLVIPHHFAWSIGSPLFFSAVVIPPGCYYSWLWLYLRSRCHRLVVMMMSPQLFVPPTKTTMMMVCSPCTVQLPSVLNPMVTPSSHHFCFVGPVTPIDAPDTEPWYSASWHRVLILDVPCAVSELGRYYCSSLCGWDDWMDMPGTLMITFQWFAHQYR